MWQSPGKAIDPAQRTACGHPADISVASKIKDKKKKKTGSKIGLQQVSVQATLGCSLTNFLPGK